MAALSSNDKGIAHAVNDLSNPPHHNPGFGTKNEDGGLDPESFRIMVGSRRGFRLPGRPGLRTTSTPDLLLRMCSSRLSSVYSLDKVDSEEVKN